MVTSWAATKTMRSGLTKRIIVLSIFWIVLTLMVTALLITWLYRDHIEQHYDAHLFTHVEELVAAVQISPDGDFSLFREPTDPRFFQRHSGWYWAVFHGDQVLQQSASLDGGRLAVMAWHYHDDDLPGPDAKIDLALEGLPSQFSQARVQHFRIDHGPD